jgi:hypothetical protein
MSTRLGRGFEIRVPIANKYTWLYSNHIGLGGPPPLKIIPVGKEPTADRMGRPIASRALLIGALGLAVAATLLSDPNGAWAADGACASTFGGYMSSASIEVRHRSIEEVLNCLSEKFDLHYRSTADLTLQITGTYQGPLDRILPRLLRRYDFFLRYSAGRIDLTILGEGQLPPKSKVEIKDDNNGHSQAEPEFGG